MSQTIDQRVVEMRFDNKQFESAIADTQKSVKNFNKNLDKEFSDSSKSLDKLEGTAEKVRLQFNLWDMLKFEALHRVLDGLIAKAESLVKSFTIEPVAAGWQKYADKTEAVQTIMNATDESIENVEKQLDKLNWFADETSYSFTDMTSNVGKFTAAGVELDKAVTAMQGISTWAALSGANTEQASRAMYNLSQAMAMGSVRVQDWMSIENANMATKEFKEMAIDAALAVGTLKKDLDGITYAPNTAAGVDVNYKNFRSTLAEGWLTDEVLTTVLEKYGKAADVLTKMQDVSGADTTSELLKEIDKYKAAVDDAAREDIFQKFISAQDLEDDTEAIKTLREQFDLLISDEYDLAVRAFKAAQEAKTFKEAINATKDAVSTKWMNVFQDIFGSYDKAKVLWTNVSNILWDIFAGPIDNLHEATKRWSKNGGLEDVHAIITGILQAISDVWQAIRDTINLIRYGTTDAEEVAEKKAEQFLKITGAIRSGVERLHNFVTSEPFQNALFAIGKVIQSVAGVFKAAWNIIKSVLFAIRLAFTSFIASLSKNTSQEKRGITFISVLDWIRQKLDDFANWLNSSGVFKFIVTNVIKFVSFILRIPGKINDAFKSITGISVGEALQKLFGKIKDGFKWVMDNKILQSIWNGIKSFFSMIGNGLKSLAGVETYGELFDKIKDVLVKVLTKIKEILSLIISKVKGLIGNSKDAESETEKEESLIIKIFKAIQSFVKTIFNSGIKGLKAINFRAIFGSLTEILQALFSGIGTIIKAVDWKQLLAGFLGVSHLIRTLNRVRIVSAITNISKGIQWFGEGIADIGVAAKKSVKALKNGALAALFASLAALIVVITVSILLISKRMSADELVKGLLYISLIIVTLTAVVKLISKMDIKTRTILSVGLLFLTIGNVLLLLAVALRIMAKIDSEKVQILSKVIVAIVLSMTIAIAALMYISNVAKPRKLASVSVLFLAIGLTMVIIASVIKKLSSLDPNRMEQATLAVIAILVMTTAMIAALMFVSNKAKPKKLASVASLFVAISLVIAIIGSVIRNLADIDSDKMINATLAVIAIMTVMTAMVSVLMLVSKKARVGKSFAMIGIVFLSIAAACLVLALSMKLIASINTKSLKTAGLVMALFAAGLAVIMLLLSKLKTTAILKATAAMVAASASLIILATALTLLYPAMSMIASINAQALLKVGIVLVSLFAILAIGGRVIKGAIPGLLGLSVVLVLVATATLMFSAALVILAPALTALASGIIYLCQSLVESSDIIVDAFKAIAEAVVGSILILVESVGMIASAFFDSLTTVLPSISNFVVAAIKAICNIIIEAAPDILTAITVLVSSLFDMLVTLVPKILEFVIAILNAVADNIKPIADALMRILIGVFQAMADNITPLVHAFADLLVNLFNALTGELPRILESLGGLLFSVVENTIGTLVKAVFQSFGEALSIFAEAAGTFWDVIKSVDPAAMAAISLLGAMMLELTAASVLESLNKLMTFGKSDTPLVALGKQLEEFAPYLTKFAQDTEGINAEHVEHVANACKMLGELATALPKSGGILQFFAGETMSMETFGTQLQAFGAAFVMFYNSIKEVFPIDSEAVESVANAGATMAGLYNKLPKEKGWAQAIFGESMSLSTFGTQLKEFGEAFVKFYDTIKKAMPIDKEVVDSVTNAGATLAGLYNKLPRQKGWTQAIFGEAMSLSTFGTQLKEFAAGFVGFYNVIKKVMPIDNGLVMSVSNVASIFANLYSKLPREGGWIDNLLGKPTSLKTFGADMVEFGKAFVSFYDVIKKSAPVDDALVTTVGNVATIFASLYEKLPHQDGWIDNFFGKPMSLKDFGNDLVDFAKGFNKFYAEISKNEIDQGIVLAVSAAAETMAGLYTKINEVGESGWLESIFGKKTINLSQFGKQLEDFGKGFNQFYIEISKNEIDQSIVDTVTTAASTMVELYKKINEVGESGWLENIFGSKTIDLGKFGTQLEDFGKGFNQFYAEIKDLDVKQTQVESVSNAASMLVELYQSLEGEKGGILGAMATAWKGDAFTNKKNALNNAISLAGIMATGMKTIQGKYTAVDLEDMRSFTNIMLNFIEAVGTIASKKDLLTELKNGGTALNTFITTMASTINTASGTAFTATGNKFVAEIVTAMTNRFQPENLRRTQEYDAFEKSVATFASFFSELLRLEIKKDAEDVALNVIEGLIIGLAKGAGQTEQAAASLAQNIIRPLQNTLQTHSPSKVTEQLGRFVSEGLAIGIRSQAALVDSASSDIAFDAMDTMSEAIRASRNIVDSALDDGSMVLTPVLDLSQIQNGAYAISQMMSDAGNYSIGGTFDYANKAYASRRSADISDPSVVSLDKLSGAIEELIRNPQGTVSNNFTINSTADPQEIAEEVSKIIQMQVERRQAVWGR